MDAYPVKVVAELLAVNEKTVYRMIWDGQIPVIRMGRVIRIPSWYVTDLQRRPGELPTALQSKSGAKR